MMIKDDSINYQRLATAQTFYRALGYRNIDTPWLVSPQAIVATLPPNSRAVESNFGCFVGSGEQGFIQLMLDGTLEPGRYQTTTPCARDEQEYTELSRKTFMKLELIHYLPEDARAAYEKVLNEAIACFFEISNVDTFEAVPTNDGFDITLNGIEIGSYGVRQMDKHVWVYGTGLAEPRFSLALSAPAPTQALTNPEPHFVAPASA
jgi:aspartyl-tRNA synthetase